jgi:hypothetical protein
MIFLASSGISILMISVGIFYKTGCVEGVLARIQPETRYCGPLNCTEITNSAIFRRHPFQCPECHHPSESER